MKISRLLLVVMMIVILSITVPYGSAETNTSYSVTQISSIQQDETKQFPNFADVVSDFVVFAEDKESYTILSNQDGVTQSFPGLQAVIIEASSDELKSLSEEISITYDYAEVFSRAIIPHFETTTVEMASSISPDEKLDAQLLRATNLWGQGYRGQNVTVAVFDNGVDFSHPALAGKARFNRDYNSEAGYEYNIPRDHGTFVAGMIAANGTADGNPDTMGTAPGAGIGAINLGQHPAGFLAGNLIAPWEWMVQNNHTVDVVNTSWGGGSTLWDPLVERLEDVNILVVGSAGNSGPSLESVGGPANAIAALAVGATTQDKELSSFSSRGYGNQLTIKPEVLGPGEDVGSILPSGQYGRSSGTSFSSPAVAGGAAVLISALEENGMEWNPGLIKTALMRGADSVTNNERFEGRGFVDLVDSWNYIQARQLDNNLPLAVDLTPSSGPVDYLRTLPQDIQFDLTMTLITSAPDQVTMDLTGDLANFATLGSIDVDRQSQVITISLDTTSVANGVYTGQVSASVSGDSVSSTLSIEIIDAPTHRGLIDTYYPGGNAIMSVGIGSSLTGAVIQSSISQGIWFDELTGPVTENLLNQYDFFWSAGASGRTPESGYGPYTTSHIISSSEIDAISNYVENGGNFILNIDGLFEITAISDSFPAGTELSVYNPLLNKFGVEGVSTPIELDYTPGLVSSISSSSRVQQVGSLTNGVEFIEHGGNYINVVDDERVEVLGYDRREDDKITMTSYVSENGGRAFISSSTSFFSNSLYLNGPSGQQDQLFTNNLMDWVTEDQRINKLSGEFSNGVITGSFHLLDGDTAGSGATVELVDNALVDGAIITPVDEGNGVYSFTVDASDDGFYEIIAEYEGNEIRYQFFVDTTGPEITPVEYENNAVFEPGEFKVLRFTIEDQLSELNKLNLGLTFDGEEVDITEIAYNDNTKEMRYLVSGDDMVDRDEPYVLSISATDTFNNTNVYDYTFWVGDGPPPSTSEESPFTSMILLLSALIAVPVLRRK